jgi:hypothetical protein
MLGEKISGLGLYGLGQQRARALPQDFGELIIKASRLNFEAPMTAGGAP